MSSKRALIGLAIGAAAGLLIAGHELFTARGSSNLRLPPEDVARALLYLVENPYVTGTTLMVEGGWTVYSPLARDD